MADDILQRINTFLVKFGPPGSPPEGREHLKWREATHRWVCPEEGCEYTHNHVDSHNKDPYKGMSKDDYYLTENIKRHHKSLDDYVRNNKNRLSHRGAIGIIVSLDNLSSALGNQSLSSFSEDIVPEIDKVINRIDDELEDNNKAVPRLMKKKAERFRDYVTNNL